MNGILDVPEMKGGMPEDMEQRPADAVLLLMHWGETHLMYSRQRLAFQRFLNICQ